MESALPGTMVRLYGATFISFRYKAVTRGNDEKFCVETVRRLSSLQKRTTTVEVVRTKLRSRVPQSLTPGLRNQVNSSSS